MEKEIDRAMDGQRKTLKNNHRQTKGRRERDRERETERGLSCKSNKKRLNMI
jgi:hypothetical protein